jgi:NitT/TauT family transport system substrate-binding protein
VQKPHDKVTVQLKWVHQAQFAGLYVAQEKGYFAEEKIDVEFKEGAAKINMVDEVVSGNAQFGVTAPEHIIKERLAGKNVRAIAAVFRRNPLVFVSKKGSGIKRPVDFLNHRIASSKDGLTQLNAVMHKLDLDFSQVKQVPYDYKYASFLNGDVEITSGYSTGGIMRMLNAGHKLNIILPSDYGVHLYSDTLFTTDKLINSNPDLVLRFLRASLKGWRDAVENPEEAVEITLKFAREKDRELQTKMFEAQLPLVHTGEDQIGWMKSEIWEGMHKLLLEQKVIPEPVELEEVYTTRFLEDIYGKMM